MQRYYSKLHNLNKVVAINGGQARVMAKKIE